MNLRKLFALLMTAVMLLGMIPVGHAEGGNITPGGEFTVGCNHNWDWRFPNGEPKHCQEERLMEMYCTLCGQVASSYPVTGDHTPGSWQWDGTPPANCYEWGLQNQSCSVCGEVFNEREVQGDHQWGGYVTETPAGCETPGEEVSYCSVCGEKGSSREIPAKGHDWGDWKWEVEAACNKEGLRVRYCKRCNMREEDYAPGGTHAFGEWKQTMVPTCTELGKREHVCTRCGYTEWGTIAKVDHNFGEWYVVTEPHVGVPGLEQRDCTYGCGTNEQREIPALEAESTAGLELTLVLSSTPANGTHFVVGEEVSFTETWSNGTDKTLYPFSVSIWTCDVPSYGSMVDQICSWFAEDGGGPVAPGATGSHALTVTVTEADVTRGAIYAMAELLSTVHNGVDLENVTAPFVTAPCGPDNSGDFDLTVTKKVSGTPANGSFYVPGETICFIISLTNDTPYPLYNVVLTDPLCEDQYFDDEINGMSYLYMDNFDSGDDPQGYSSAQVAPTYVVTEADAEAGFVTNTAIVNYQTGNGENKTASASVTVKCGKASDAVVLEKIDMRSPANGEYYVPGEVIKYGLTVRSTEDNPLQNIIIYDPLKGGDQVVFGPADSWVLGAGFDYTVTEADAQRGYIENTGYATFTYQNTGEDGTVYSNTLTLPCGFVKDAGLSSALSLTKSVTSTPANGSFYVPGETVTYELCVKNNGEPLNDLDVSDWMWGDERAWVGSFATGEAVIYPVTHIVTDADARAKHVNNIACATAIDQDGNQMTEYSNLVTVPCGFPEGDDPFGIFHSLAVVKVEESLPLNGEYYTEGEVIHYSITYTNDGELPLTDVQVWDTMDINTTIGHAETLQPGESRTCYYQHTVTAADVDAGIVLNMAQANYPIPGDDGYVGVNSNLVSSKTSPDGIHCVVLPIFPTPGEDPEYDPGTGWFTTEEESESPNFGTIDTDALHGGDTYCARTIIGQDNVSATYETTFCTEHAATQSSALIMAQAAATPEMQMQSAAYAATLWRSEVEKLYQEICAASDPAAKTVAMTEYVRFLADVTNYEAMLSVLYPDQPALVAQKVAAMWENKCIDLCYDAHATAAERKDSLLAVTPAAGAAAVNCTCEVTAQEAGKKTSVQSYCAVHSFPFSMIDALLQGNDTADAWTMVRQIWGVELTSAYNKIYTAMGDNKLLAMAEYNALTQWMMAREASLIALYPENPEIVVQIMVKTIMDRVNDLCQITQ